MSDDDTLVSGVHEEKEWRIRRVQDSDVESPREWENAWVLVMKHRRRTLGDKQMTASEFEDFADEEGLNTTNCITVPIFAYEHGGIAFSLERTGQFADQFDSGVIGQAYMTVAKLKEEYGADTEETREKALNTLRAELETYEQFINGDTYGFVYETRPAGADNDDDDLSWEEEDSCYGFYGSDPKENGMKEHFPEHVRAQMDAPAPAPVDAAPARRRRSP
jgi:hypothetical protein